MVGPHRGRSAAKVLEGWPLLCERVEAVDVTRTRAGIDADLERCGDAHRNFRRVAQHELAAPDGEAALGEDHFGELFDLGVEITGRPRELSEIGASGRRPTSSAASANKQRSLDFSPRFAAG